MLLRSVFHFLSPINSQLMIYSGAVLLGLFSYNCLAILSFPVPVSPIINTGKLFFEYSCMRVAVLPT